MSKTARCHCVIYEQQTINVAKAVVWIKRQMQLLFLTISSLLPRKIKFYQSVQVGYLNYRVVSPPQMLKQFFSTISLEYVYSMTLLINFNKKKSMLKVQTLHPIFRILPSMQLSPRTRLEIKKLFAKTCEVPSIIVNRLVWHRPYKMSMNENNRNQPYNTSSTDDQER